MSIREWLRRIFVSSEVGKKPLTEERAAVDRVRTRGGARGKPRLVVVGLDFGTSSCKVVCRDLHEKGRPAFGIDFGTASRGFSRFSFPSTIAVLGSDVVFGEEALGAADEADWVGSSPKIQLIQVNERVDSVPAPRTAARILRAYRRFDPRPMMLEILTAGLLSCVIRTAFEALKGAHPGLTHDELLFNVDVPVDALGHSDIEDRYWRLMTVAVSMSQTSLRDSSLGSLADAWASGMEQWQRTEVDPRERKVELVPEAQAVIQGAGEAVPRDRDVYKAIIDVGAGTTDIGWFKLVSRPDGDRLPFFASATTQLGCDAVDEAMSEELTSDAAERKRLVRKLRGLKASLINGASGTVWAGHQSVVVGPELLSAASERIGADIYGFYKGTFGQAYAKEKDVNRWRDLQVVIVGGGSLLPQIRKPFGNHPARIRGTTNVELLDIGDRVRLNAIGRSTERSAVEDAPFLLPALGLSYPRIEMPEPILPEDIPPLPKPPSGPTGPYDYECEDLA